MRKRLILLVPLLALFAFVAMTEERAEAIDEPTRVEGEDFDVQPTGTKVVRDSTYYSPPNYEALKFTNDAAIAEEPVTFGSNGDVVLWVRGGQPNGSPTLRVKVDNGAFSPYQTITNNKTPVAYTFNLNVSAGPHTIKVNAGNTGTERYPFVDFVTFTGSGGTDPGGDRDGDTIPDTEDNCPDVYNKGQIDDDNDGVGNKCDDGSTPPTDTDNDGVIDADDQCDTQAGPPPTGCPTDPGGDRDGDTIPDTEDNCPDVYNKGQIDDDNDGVGNKCDDGSTTLPDADRDGVPDSTDQCDNDPGPAPTGCPADPGGTTTWPNCIGTHIRSGDNLASIINNDSGTKATRFCVHRGTYTVSTQAYLKAGDKLDAEPGTWDSFGPARVPTPLVKLEGRGTDNLLRADGNDVSISWVDLSGASGTGNGTGAIAAGSAGSDFLVEYSRIHDNDSLGISNMNGTVRYSEFFMNSGAPSSLGFNGSAVKGITEYEADRVYVHDEQGNGLWCDVGCKNSARDMNDLCPTGCFWVHDSVVEDSRRAGIRYENSSSEALFQNNVIRGNGISEHRGGIDIRDSQDAQVLDNTLSANNGIGVRATDSGRSDRVNLDNILVQDNDLGNDLIVTCGGPVECINNTNVGTK